MNKKIEDILSELYEKDPELKNNEKELKNTLDMIMKNNPIIEIDSEFKNELKNKLFYNINPNTNMEKGNLFKYIFWTFSVAAIASIVWISYYSTNNLTAKIEPENSTAIAMIDKSDNKIDTETKSVDNILAFADEIRNVEPNKFWNLWTTANNDENIARDTQMNYNTSASLWGWSISNENMEYSRSAEASYMSMPMVAESQNNDIPTMKKLSAVNIDNSAEIVSNAMIEPSIMPYPWDYVYIPEIVKYNFNWELNLELWDTMKVYKKEKQNNNTDLFNNVLKNINFAWINLSGFSNLKVSNMSINEDKENWYSLYLDFENSSLSIWKNWTKWNNDINSEKYTQLSDNELLSIANDFVKSYNIDVSKYWNPIVESNNNSHLIRYAGMEAMDNTVSSDMAVDSKMMIAPDYYFPNSTVIFPLIVDWNEIKEENGQNFGLRIEIDNKNKKVSSLNWLNSMTYAASEYSIENDNKNILKVTNAGWRYWLYENGYNEGEYKEINVELENPKIIYINYYIYNYENNTSDEYFIPAISFDIIKDESNSNYIYNNSVIVPLVKDFYNYWKQWEIISTK